MTVGSYAKVIADVSYRKSGYERFDSGAEFCQRASVTAYGVESV